MALDSFRIVAAIFYSLLYFSFCDKNGNLAHNDKFLLQTKCRAADKSLEQCFLKEFIAACKNSGEFELKPATKLKGHLGQSCSQPFNYYSFGC